MTLNEWRKTDEYAQLRAEEEVRLRDLKQKLKRWMKWSLILALLAIAAYNSMGLAILGGAALIAYVIFTKKG